MMLSQNIAQISTLVRYICSYVCAIYGVFITLYRLICLLNYCNYLQLLRWLNIHITLYIYLSSYVPNLVTFSQVHKVSPMPLHYYKVANSGTRVVLLRNILDKYFPPHRFFRSFIMSYRTYL